MTEEVAALAFRLDAKTAQFEAAMKRAQRQLDTSTKRMEAQVGRTDRKLKAFGADFAAGLARLGVGAGLGAAFVSLGRRTAAAGEQVRVLAGRFEALTGSAERAGSLVRNVFDVAGGTGTSVQAVGDLVAQMRLATEQIGASDAEVVSFTENLLKLGAIGGSSTQEAANGLRQLSQGLAGGVLRAEEFNSVIENTPLVAKALADELAGGSLGALRAMVLEGKVLSEDVFRAILKQSGEIGENFEKIPLTMERAFSNAQTALTRMLSGLDEMLGVSAAIVSNVERLADAANKIGFLLSPEGRARGAQEDLVANFNEVNRQLRLTEGDPNAGPLRAQLLARQQELAAQIKAGVAEINALSGAGGAAPSAAPAAAGVTGGGAARAGGGGARAEGSAYADLLARMREANAERRDEIRLLGLSGSARIEEAAAIERTRLANALYAAAARDGRAVTAAQRAEIEDYVEVTIELSRQLSNAETAQRAQADAIETTARAAEDAKRNIETIGNALTNSALQANSFTGALKNVALQLANIGIQGLFGAGPAAGLGAALFGPPADFGVRGPVASAKGNAKGNVFSGGNVVPFAKGGIVGGPTLFPMPKGMGLMGEAGPEAILPLKRGPGGRLGVEAGGGGGGGVTINVDARGATDPAATAAAVRAALAQSEANTVRILREMERRR